MEPSENIEDLRRELREAHETLEAIRNGEVDAFVMEQRGLYRVEALTGADTPYRLLVESMRDGALTISLTGIVLYCNQPFTERAGRLSSEIVGRDAAALFHLQRGTLRQLLEEAIHGEVKVEGHLRSGDALVPVAITACALPSEEGANIFCLLLTDLSERVEAEELKRSHASLARQREELSAICNRLPFAVLLAETTSYFSYVNPVARALLDRHPGLGSVVGTAAAAVLAGRAIAAEEVTLRTASGTEATFSVHATPLEVEAAQVRALVVLEDVTAEHQSQKIRQEQDQLREMFVGILGHDLRGPLAVVMTASELLLQQVDADRVRRTADRIHRATVSMRRLIDDMLDLTLSRIGGGIPLALARTNLQAVVQAALDEMQPKPDLIDLQVDGDVTGVWDAARLQQLISNLLINAVKHGGGKVPIAVRLDGSRHDQVRLSVTNDGNPIPSEIMSHIFDPFRQGTDAPASRGHGVGLGLYIAEQIVSAHEGRISATSSAGDGTTFTVELPRVCLRPSERPPKGDR